MYLKYIQIEFLRCTQNKMSNFHKQMLNVNNLIVRKRVKLIVLFFPFVKAKYANTSPNVYLNQL